MAETSSALAVREEAPIGLFNTDNPKVIVQKAAAVASTLTQIITSQKLSTKIGGKDYILVEGWTTLGSLVGVFPATEYTRPVQDAEGETVGWEAAVVVRNTLGTIIGRAEAQCLRSERNWKSRDDFALRSMAQTRAQGKALRMPLGWIAVMGGFEATPAEEMPKDDDVPFEPSLPTQDPAANDAAGGDHGSSGTGGEGDTDETVMARREAAQLAADAARLTDKLLHALDELGSRAQNEHLIAKDPTKNAQDPAAHVAWLERQLKTAKASIKKQKAAAK